TLIEIKAAKPKAITSTATTTTTTRPKARGVIVQDPSEFKTTSSPSQASQHPQAKEVAKKEVSDADPVTTSNAITTTIDELTLAQTLIEIKEAKPKAVTSTATTTTTTRYLFSIQIRIRT
ncbi:hypothetical protein Tco_1537260, partial [Tanacetum coccineum]